LGGLHWGCFGPSSGLIDFWELGCYFLEELLNIGSSLGTDLLKRYVIPVCQFLPLSQGDIPLFQIDLISQHSDNHSIAPLVLNIIDPLLNALEGLPVGDVVYDDGY
jgi:hypothetical protein